VAQRVTPVGTRRRRWPWLLALALLVVPTAEIAVILAVGRTIGTWPTVALLIVESALGAWLVKREGSRTWTALAQAINSGRMPSRQLADSALVLVGGTLLLTPGFLTDIAGFFFVLPVTRALARNVLEQVVTRRLLGGLITVRGESPPDPYAAPGTVGGARRSAAADDTIRGEVIEGEILEDDPPRDR